MPLIDLAPARLGGPAERRRVADAIDVAEDRWPALVGAVTTVLGRGSILVVQPGTPLQLRNAGDQELWRLAG